VAGAGQQQLTEAGELDDPMVAGDGVSDEESEEESPKVCVRCNDHMQLAAEFRDKYKVERDRRILSGIESEDLLKTVYNLRADNGELVARDVALSEMLRNAVHGSLEYKNAVLGASKDFTIAVRNLGMP
jgi:hypothetical protein